MKKNDPKELKKSLLETIGTNSVSDAESFREAVVLLGKAQAKIANLSLSISEYRNLANQLNAAVCDYADSHPGDLDTPFAPTGKYTKAATVSIDGTDYQYVIGKGSVKRIDGGKIFKDFIKSLPEGWWTSEPQLDSTYIIDFTTENERKRRGLFIEPERKWRAKAK